MRAAYGEGDVGCLRERASSEVAHSMPLTCCSCKLNFPDLPAAYRGRLQDQQQRGCGGGSPRQTRGGAPPRRDRETDRQFRTSTVIPTACKRPLAARAPFTSPYYNGRVGVAVCLCVFSSAGGCCPSLTGRRMPDRVCRRERFAKKISGKDPARYGGSSVERKGGQWEGREINKRSGS